MTPSQQKFGISPDVIFRKYASMSTDDAEKIYNSGIRYAHNIDSCESFNDVFAQLAAKSTTTDYRDVLIEEILAKNIMDKRKLTKDVETAMDFRKMLNSYFEESKPQLEIEQQQHKLCKENLQNSLNKIKELETRLDQSLSEFNGLKNQIESITNENEILKAKQLENGKSETTISDLKERIRAINDNNSFLNNENKTLKQNETKLQEQVNVKDDEAKILFSKVKELEKKLDLKQKTSYHLTNPCTDETLSKRNDYVQQTTTATTTTNAHQTFRTLKQSKEEEEEEKEKQVVAIVPQPLPLPPSFIVYITEQTFLENINENFSKVLVNCRVETLPNDPKKMNRNSLIIYTKNVYGSRTDSDADLVLIKDLIARYALDKNNKQSDYKYPIIHASFIYGKASAGSFVSLSNDLCQSVQISYETLKGISKLTNKSAIATIQSSIDSYCQNIENNNHKK